jgi:hypothetical protein
MRDTPLLHLVVIPDVIRDPGALGANILDSRVRGNVELSDVDTSQ